jgi:hypothetical protein
MSAAKLVRHPALLVGLLYAAFVMLLLRDAARLPERVATHFDWRGQANGWMSARGYLIFMAIFGLVVPLFPAAMTLLARFLPTSFVNIPHRAYWLAAERRGETAGYLYRHTLWLGTMSLGLFIALHQLTVEANERVPVQLSHAIWVPLAMFIVAMFLWILALVRHFRLPKTDLQRPVSA